MPYALCLMKSFSRTIEDFSCLHCGERVRGDGYTNHCPRCLWSRDVDVNPGDRESKCGGMMKPIAASSSRDGYIIVHKCEKCGKRRRQRSAKNDDTDAIIALAANNDFIFGGTESY